MKEKLLDALGAFGGILYFVISTFVYVLPIVMIGKPFWLDLIFLA